MPEKILTSIIVGVVALVFSSLMGLALYFLKKYFEKSLEQQKTFFTGLFNPLSENLKKNTQATDKLLDQLTSIRIEYPKQFADREEVKQNFARQEAMINSHDKNLNLINNHLQIKC